MGANFDISLILKRKINYSEVVGIINSFSYEIDVQEVWTIDNWLYENQNEITMVLYRDIDKFLDQGKIVVTYVTLDKRIRGGFYLVHQNNQAVINLWIDTKMCEYLDCNTVDTYNEKVYKKIVSWMIHMKSKLSIEICAIGSETDFAYEGTIKECIEQSENIVCWILFNNTIDFEISGYNVKNINQGFVFWK